MKFRPRGATRLGRWKLAVVLASAASLLAAAPAAADTVKLTLVVDRGGISLHAGDLGMLSLTLDGTDKAPSYPLPLTLTDSSGSGNGWRVSVAATRLSTGGASPRALPSDALMVRAVRVSCAAGSTCDTPVNSVRYPLPVPAAGEPSVPLRLLDAARDSGLGGFAATACFLVKVPADALSGACTGLLTLAIIGGP